ncbi:hypothetical protein EGW08_001255, partial [Elysia chlorotica]
VAGVVGRHDSLERAASLVAQVALHADAARARVDGEQVPHLGAHAGAEAVRNVTVGAHVKIRRLDLPDNSPDLSGHLLRYWHLIKILGKFRRVVVNVRDLDVHRGRPRERGVSLVLGNHVERVAVLVLSVQRLEVQEGQVPAPVQLLLRLELEHACVAGAHFVLAHRVELVRVRICGAFDLIFHVHVRRLGDDQVDRVVPEPGVVIVNVLDDDPHGHETDKLLSRRNRDAEIEDALFSHQADRLPVYHGRRVDVPVIAVDAEQ